MSQQLFAVEQNSSVDSSTTSSNLPDSVLILARQPPTPGQQPDELGPAILATLRRIANALERLSTPDDHPASPAIYKKSTATGTPKAVEKTDAMPTSTPVLEDSNRLAALEAGVADIRHLLKAQSRQVVKQAYSVPEVAELTGYKEWTIRQGCNTGRVKAKKGDDGRWRVAHDELVRLQEEGLPSE